MSLENEKGVPTVANVDVNYQNGQSEMNLAGCCKDITLPKLVEFAAVVVGIKIALTAIDAYRAGKKILSAAADSREIF